ncbi:MAG TPA: CoB--CoM heterodisulfide reductase iron-sulfur subunit B family protein [Anaerolineae bacterium]|nr:CoB--CoM heterodisulfide reductase iron-sulfur subunit B family protein [Anaerolineae bacterium]
MRSRYAFYPGCTLHSTGVEFGASTELVCEALGLEMVEIDDWNCCGASSAHSMDDTLFLALPARNLAKAQAVELDDLAIPCAACYSRTAAADLALREDEVFRSTMEAVLGFQYQGRVRPRNLLDIFANDMGKEQLAAKVTRPLAGLRVVSYYGCLLIRPPQYTQRWDDPEHPQAMDDVVELMGAEAVPWSYGIDCCGGSLTLNRSDVVVHLVDKLARAAHEAGADALVTACPMCMANVDGRQLYRSGPPIPRPPKPDYEPLPIFYFTELMALAYGLPMKKVLGKHLVSPKPLLGRLGIV